MKKWIAILTLCTFTLYANPAPTQNPNPEAPPVTTSPIYATPSPSVNERGEPKKDKWRATAAVIGTAAAVTLGLFLSGRDTGKRQHTTTNNESHK